MANYFLTNQAVEDLAKIWDYTYEVWSESQADKYYELLTNSFEDIVQNPWIGRIYDEINNATLGLRVGKHIIFYQVIQSENIEIIRILHQRMDLKSRIDE